MYIVVYKETNTPEMHSKIYESHIEKYTNALDVVEQFYQDHQIEDFKAYVLELDENKQKE